MHYFRLLDADAQKSAIARMHRSGMSDGIIASATKLSIEQVRRTLAETSGAT